VAETEAPIVELLEEVRPLARELAVVLVRQELAGLATSLNGAASSSPALAPETAVSGPENARASGASTATATGASAAED
jgi:hypothetical protein